MEDRENELKLTKESAVIILIALNLYPIYLSFVAFLRVGKFQKIFEEILEGEPLPIITNILFATYKFFGLIPILFIILAFGVLFIKKHAAGYATLLGVLTLISALSMRILMVEGLFQPFILIINKLGG